MKPVVPEPIEVGELLVGELVDLAVRPGDKSETDEVIEVQGRQRELGAVTGDPITDRHGTVGAEMGADVIGVR